MIRASDIKNNIKQNMANYKATASSNMARKKQLRQEQKIAYQKSFQKASITRVKQEARKDALAGGKFKRVISEAKARNEKKNTSETPEQRKNPFDMSKNDNVFDLGRK